MSDSTDDDLKAMQAKVAVVSGLISVATGAVALLAWFGIGSWHDLATKVSEGTTVVPTRTTYMTTYIRPTELATINPPVTIHSPVTTYPPVTTIPAAPAAAGDCVSVTDSGYGGIGDCNANGAPYEVISATYGSTDCGNRAWVNRDGYRLCLRPHFVDLYCYKIPSNGWITSATCYSPGSYHVVAIISYTGVSSACTPWFQTSGDNVHFDYPGDNITICTSRY